MDMGGIRVGRGAGAPGARGAKNERSVARARGAEKERPGEGRGALVSAP